MTIYINSLECSLPTQKVNNFDLEKIMDTNDEWIKTRTGIEERRFLKDDESGLSHAVEASKKALHSANINANELSHIFVATCSPHMLMPSMACMIAGELEITNKNIFSLDFNAACSGFVYGLELVTNFIKANPQAKILLITSEVLSRKINFEDRTTAVLFGDGASAAIITNKINTHSKKQFSLVDTACYTDGNFHNLITLGGGTAKKSSIGDSIDEDFFIQMQGREVYKLAVRSMSQSCIDILEKNKLSLENLNFVVPHQANMRIIEAVCDRLSVPDEKRFINVQKYGNTSASSIPIALDELFEFIIKKNYPPKQRLLLTSFGAGLTWGASILETL